MEKLAAPIRMKATDDQLQPPSASARHVAAGGVLRVCYDHDEGRQPDGDAGDQGPEEPALVDRAVKARYGGDSHERRPGQYADDVAAADPPGLGGNAVGDCEDDERR